MTTETQARRMETDELRKKLRKMIRLYERKEMIDWDEEDPERLRVEEEIILLSKEADKRIEDTSDAEG